MMDRVNIRRALISVSHKEGLETLGKRLAKYGIEIISTGGTAKTLSAAGLNVKDIADLTGFPEMMDGRVKTLHPAVHGGILARRDKDSHLAAMTTHDIAPIDLVIIDLYPFEQALASGASDEDMIENIDIGGPAMIRSAAKNHVSVTVIISNDDFSPLFDELERNQGAITYPFRRQMAAKAFARTASYDAMIANWMRGTNDPGDFFAMGANKANALRYGENPHQTAGLYLTGEKRIGVANAFQHQGKQLSYNNINDTDAAFELVSEFYPEEGAAVAIIKHANPCGVACDETLTKAYNRALACDPVSAFGGIIALNRPLDIETAQEISKIFTEVIIAPGVSDEAKEFLATKPNLRLLTTNGLADPAASRLHIRSVAGGLLVQQADNGQIFRESLQIVTHRAPTESEWQDMLFAFKICKHVKSNAIIYAKDGATVGIGAGQMSRVDSARIAAQKAKDITKDTSSAPLTQGSVAASDAFFPFADGLQSVIEAGATAVIQPGGSIRDSEVIEYANTNNIAMVTTGIRHFRH